MIRKLKYNEIDFSKYAKCVENAAQYKYSAEKDFLDISSNHCWELLVFNDYEAVMPITFVRKLGLKLVINPKLCQQLGVFSLKDDPKINDLFLDFLEKKCHIWYYAFNAKNNFSRKLQQRKNFLIPSENYEIVQKKYSPKRKRKLRLDDEVLENSFLSTEIDFEVVVDFIKKNISRIVYSGDVEDFIAIFNAFYQSNDLQFYGFFYHQKLINLIAVHVSEKTVALLGTFNHPEYIKLSGSSSLIDFVIKEYIHHKIFDFEGSEIPSVQEFFRGFRPVEEKYAFVNRTKFDIIKRLLKISR